MSNLSCRYPDCLSDRLIIQSGTAPHHARLQCQQCDRFQKWLSKSECDRLRLVLPSQMHQQTSLFGGEL